MATSMQQRRGTAAEWAAANPILKDGEIGFERDTKVIKIGDGTTSWNDLQSGYIRRAGSDVIAASGPSVIPLRFRGAASQVADLAQFQKSDGTVLSRVGPDGKVYEGASKYLTSAEAVSGYEPRFNRTGAVAGQVPIYQSDGTMKLQPNPAASVFDVAGFALGNWQPRTAYYESNGGLPWSQVIWVSQLNLFVAAATDYAGASPYYSMQTSPDGIVWTARSITTNRGISSVVYAPELAMFVGVSNAGGGYPLATSPDALSWAAKPVTSANLPYQIWSSVTWSPTLRTFVGVSSAPAASSGVAFCASDPTLIANWSSKTAAAIQPWNSVTWVAQLNLFVAVGTNATLTTTVMTSPDGITWTLRSAISGTWNSVTYSPSLGLLVAVSATGKVMTSKDAITWTLRNTPYSATLTSVTWISDLNYFVATGQNTVITSSDAINWFVKPAPPGLWNSIAWAPTLRYAVGVASGTTSNHAMTSLAIPS